MKKTNKVLLLALCLTAALLLSGCHADPDPWYEITANPQQATQEPAQVMQEPQAQPTQSTDTENNAVTEPQPTQDSTEQPGGEEEPGLNG
ncbi:MAG: hypothetical protein RSE58_11665 [Clostridia bacterium]